MADKVVAAALDGEPWAIQELARAIDELAGGAEVVGDGVAGSLSHKKPRTRRGFMIGPRFFLLSAEPRGRSADSIAFLLVQFQADQELIVQGCQVRGLVLGCRKSSGCRCSIAIFSALVAKWRLFHRSIDQPTMRRE